MPNRAELVARWQDQLATAESLLETDACRLRWLWRMRTRLFRFLLSCYGEGSWTPEHESTTGDIDPPLTPFIDNTAELSGLQPKSPARIRSALKSVHNANDRVETAGPYALGLVKEDWIRVAAFRDGTNPGGFMKLLASSGIAARKRAIGREIAVEVQRVDFDAAIALFRELAPRTSQPALREARIARWVVGAFLFLILVALLLAAIVSTQYFPNSKVALSELAVFCGLAVIYFLTLLLAVLGGKLVGRIWRN